MSPCHGVILTGWSAASIGGGLIYTGVVNAMTKHGGYTLGDPFVYVVNQYWILSLLACGWLALLFIRTTPRERMFPRVHGQVFCHTLAGITLRLARGTMQNGLRDYEFLATAPDGGHRPATAGGNGIIDGDESAYSTNGSIAVAEKHLTAVSQLEDIGLRSHAGLIRSHLEGEVHDAGIAGNLAAKMSHESVKCESPPEAFNYVADDGRSTASASASVTGACASCVQLTCTTPPPRWCLPLLGRWRLERVSSEEVATIWRMYLSCALLASVDSKD
ncbi:hypothetical protein IWQ56_005130 [Coemansia nantahalensis]|nr:hypothetical protein IWQ56_005130 [Coemansia nantahalensis]